MKIQYKKKHIVWSINWEFYLVLIKNKKFKEGVSSTQVESSNNEIKKKKSIIELGAQNV